MRIIISPAKKMRRDDILAYQNLPRFIDETEILKKQLESMSDEALKKLWKCNDNIASLNIERIQKMDVRRNLSPAIFAYEGIQYTYMAPGVFTRQELAYLEEHLRILSGFYGLLRPFDGVVSYRLEMQAKLRVENFKNLYDFWGDKMAQALFEETDVIINLASQEYSNCISPYLSENKRLVNCVFGELINGKLTEKGTLCKMARGEMVRFMAENNIEDFERIREFNRLGYRYSAKRSNENTYVFIKDSQAI